MESYEMKHFDWLASGAEFYITDLAENIQKIGKQLLIIVGIVFPSVLTARTSVFKTLGNISKYGPEVW